eukprot:1829907-Prymnesium_polylepis.1
MRCVGDGTRGAATRAHPVHSEPAAMHSVGDAPRGAQRERRDRRATAAHLGAAADGVTVVDVDDLRHEF